MKGMRKSKEWAVRLEWYLENQTMGGLVGHWMDFDLCFGWDGTSIESEKRGCDFSWFSKGNLDSCAENRLLGKRGGESGSRETRQGMMEAGGRKEPIRPETKRHFRVLIIPWILCSLLVCGNEPHTHSCVDITLKFTLLSPPSLSSCDHFFDAHLPFLQYFTVKSFFF